MEMIFNIAMADSHSTSSSVTIKLLYMLKAPVQGAVKTRLATSIGEMDAAIAYRSMVEFQLKTLKAFDHEIHYTPAGSIDLMSNWLGADRNYFPQSEGHLGQRMLKAAEGAFQRKAKSVCLLGGDCPYLTNAIILEANLALQSHDLVIGPAKDGGYYLLAFKCTYPTLFEGIAWSTKTVFDETLSKAKQLDLKVHRLEPLEDVDEFDSWKRAKALLGK
ncbi:TIGR04282 family arsenosugar biosynthesis glycosyltransferase [Rubellicoccus peritrichatus]|uniref:TIGR04282 family arsenosugar biosynthesis glycosyltransferase n=1 Tax=Rubellicoccus peritrichatus TaxID=3080537 RepID=A0AAQ3QU70_9BACT|nr:TIGR04282 family arsenosugar biosynthesis glycosyltransferase [Puniceicoccus sp. CR14]WOO39332.1 TIGR04282 family arsenosugar biosynthesis glycosyltransferase [Puniceicoccus sp. CR14]